MTCGTCKWLQTTPDSFTPTGRLKKTPYGCAAPVPQPVLPDSVTGAHSFRWPPFRRAVWANEGVTCPTWETRPALPHEDQDQ